MAYKIVARKEIALQCRQ